MKRVVKTPSPLLRGYLTPTPPRPSAPVAPVRQQIALPTGPKITFEYVVVRYGPGDIVYGRLPVAKREHAALVAEMWKSNGDEWSTEIARIDSKHRTQVLTPDWFQVKLYAGRRKQKDQLIAKMYVLGPQMASMLGFWWEVLGRVRSKQQRAVKNYYSRIASWPNEANAPTLEEQVF